MRIAMLTNNYKPFIGGVPISIERLSESLRQLGHEVYIFAPTYDNQVDEEGVIRYHSYKKKMNGEVTVPYVFDPYIEEQFKKLQIDVIHVHHPHFVGWMATHLGKKYNIPVVYTYHTRYEQYVHHIKGFSKLEEISKDEEAFLINYIARGILKVMKEKLIPKIIRNYGNKCDMVFAPTTLMKEILLQMDVKASMEVLPTGLNDQFFKEDRISASKIRSKYIEDKQYLFCTVSRLSKEKNIGFLIEGLEKLKRKVGNTFRILIIGDGPLKEELQDEVRKLGLEENVVFLKSVLNHEIKNYYSACDVFLFASKSETQGIVLLEAMARKNPIVAIKASGVVEVVRNGINGYMTEDNVEEWSNCIKNLMGDEEQMKRLRKGAYETAVSYGGEKVGQDALSYYNKAIQLHQTKAKNDKYEEIYQCS